MQNDDEIAYRDYVAVRMPHLRRIAYLVCGDWHVAEDAVSSALVKLYLCWHRARQVDSLDAYTRTMVLRSVVDEHRRPWRRERADGSVVVSSESRPDQTGAVTDRLVLRGALAQLPRGRRAVLVLRYYEGLSVEETADALGCSTGNVKSQTARGLAALRDLLPAEFQITGGGTHD